MGVTKQEQQPARDGVDEVAAGVVRMQLPIHMPGLAHVNCYGIFDRTGVTIVDPGVPGPASWRSLRRRMRLAGIKIRDVHTVVVTHSHPDHFGGAGRLANEADADLMTHAAFRTWDEPQPDPCVDEEGEDAAEGADGPAGGPTQAEVSGERDDADDVPWGKTTPWGGQGYRGVRGRRLMWRVMRRTGFFVMPRPTVRVEDGQEVQLGSRTWLALHTPGHTRDHLCLFEPDTGTLVSGDHVLPTITPHISGLGSGPDPLAEFFTSLDRVAGLPDVAQALPAHGLPIADVAGRVGDIKLHHEERLDRLRQAGLALGPSTVEDLSHELFRQARWGPMAESETYAHLEYLRRQGQAERHEVQGRLVYAVVDSRAGHSETALA